MSKVEDWTLLGQLIRREHVYAAETTRLFAKKAQISSASLYKIFDGWDKTRPQALARIEEALSWPRGTVDAVVSHDDEWLRANIPASLYRQMINILQDRRDRQDRATT